MGVLVGSRNIRLKYLDYIDFVHSISEQRTDQREDLLLDQSSRRKQINNNLLVYRPVNLRRIFPHPPILFQSLGHKLVHSNRNRVCHDVS